MTKEEETLIKDIIRFTYPEEVLVEVVYEKYLKHKGLL